MIRRPLDPRSICNLILDEARDRTPPSNLSLQKLLYFVHGLYLVDTKTPLVSGYFEAWQYGPVHPAAYRAFKCAGDQPITFRAHGKDPLTGAARPLEPPTDRDVILQVRRVMAAYGPMTSGQLVELSHAKGAPWDATVDKARTSMAFGMRISDTVILERFKHHKVSIGITPSKGEPLEDAPFA